MLSLMRKHAGSWLIKVTLGAIVIVFVFWGVGSYRDQRGDRVAVVDGKTISIDEYRNVYERLMDQYRKQFGKALDQNLLKALNLRKQAIDQLINRQLLLQEAGRLDFRVTKEVVARAIQKMAAFQHDGQFDVRHYERVLASNRMTPEIFEESMTQDLLSDKMQRVVLGSAKVSDEEALETFRWREEKVSLDYVAFKAPSYKDVKASAEEIESYFSEHEKNYETLPQVKVRYVSFVFKEFESNVNVSEEEITQYFELNQEKYGSPKRVKARHVLFRLAPDAKPEEIEEVRNKAQKVLDEAKAGADFAKLAEKHSDDPGSKTKGGDLGFFTKERMVKPFADAAFAMKPGEISEPVKTSFGWHVIKVEQVEEAKEPVLAEKKDKIVDKLTKDGARTVAYDRAEDFYEASYGAGHIAGAAEAQQLEAHETEFFARRDRIKGITQADKFAKVTFGLPDDEVSEPVELSDGYYILEVIDRKPAAIPELETVEKKVTDDLIKARQDELAKKDADEFLDAIRKGAEFQAEAKSRKLEGKTTDFFKRSGSIPGIGFEQEILDSAFSLDTSAPLPDAVIKGRQGYYVIRFKDRQEADIKEFEAKKSETKSGIITQKRQRLMDDWFAQLREKSEITIEEGFLD